MNTNCQQRNCTILIVDDEAGIRFGLRGILEREGFHVLEADTGEAALELVRKQEIDIVLLDIRLGSVSGIDLITRIKAVSSDIQIIIVTGYGTIDTAVTAMKQGAADYILKPVEKQQLLRTVELAEKKRLLETENAYLRDELTKKSYPGKVITGNQAMKQLLDVIDQVKGSGCTILLSGETGSGKEVIAQYIHYTGPRKRHNFVALNCASLSEELIQSELFGHVRGAFTGAVEHRTGKLELADKGTLFLDEIGEMPLSIQAKLLKVLEERWFEKVGGVRKIHVDIQLTAATHRDLPAMVREGSFREDLYFRLNVIQLQIPPLRSRPDDISLLAGHFIATHSQRYHKQPFTLEENALELLCGYSWPGNVRELQNLMNRVTLLADRPSLDRETLVRLAGLSLGEEAASEDRTPAAGQGGRSAFGEQMPVREPSPADSGSLQERIAPVVEYYERKILLETLQKYRGNRTRTAEELGITRQTVLSKVNQHGIDDASMDRDR